MNYVKKHKDNQEPIAANLYIKNLEKSICQDKLNKLFSPFGTILSCKVDNYEDGTSKGFGFVQFEKEEEASAAIAEMNNKEIEGKEIEVMTHEKKDARPSEPKFNNLIVSNLTPEIDDAKFEAMFKDFGEIESIALQKTTENVSKGFGFVCYKSPDAAKEALKQMDRKEIEDGKVIFVSQHLSKKEMEKQSAEPNSLLQQNLKFQNKSNLYVKFLPYNITEDEFKKAFETKGKVLSVKINKKTVTDTQNKEIVIGANGYVLYQDVKDAQVAI